MSRPVKSAVNTEVKTTNKVVIRPYRKVDPRNKEIEPGLMLEGARVTLAPYSNLYGIFKCDIDQEQFEKTSLFKEGIYKTLNDYLINAKIVLTSRETVLFPDENETHMLIVSWLKYHPEVAWSTENINPYSTKFVAFSEVEKAKNELDKAKTRLAAYKAVEELRTDEMRDILLWAFGISSYTSHESVVQEKLFSFAETQPEKVIAAIKDSSRGTKAIISKALQKNILKKRNNSIFYGDTFLGTDLEQAAAMLDSLENQEIKIAIKKSIETV